MRLKASLKFLYRITFNRKNITNIFIFLCLMSLPYLIHVGYYFQYEEFTTPLVGYLLCVFCAMAAAFLIGWYYELKIERINARWEFERGEREMAILDRFRETIALVNKNHTKVLSEIRANAGRQDKS